MNYLSKEEEFELEINCRLINDEFHIRDHHPTEDNSHPLQDRKEEYGRDDQELYYSQEIVIKDDLDENSSPNLFFDIEQPSQVDVFDLSSRQENVFNPNLPLLNRVEEGRNVKGKQLKKKRKNSNSIKKIGRIILDHTKEFSINGRENSGVRAMKISLNRSSKDVQTAGNKRDCFNLSHLSILLSVSDVRVSEHNLRTTRKILCKYLREQVLSSHQITDESKLIYLNTLKCSALRCANRKLAVRLQMSDK